MFEQLQSRLGEIFTRLRGRGTLSPDDVDAALREVRLALLEADVNFKVARDFAARVREAAVAQVQVVGQTAGVPVFALEGAADPVEVARAALDQARRTADVLIIDSAGRLHIDDGLLAELARIREATAPHNTLLVLDAMAGQDAVRMAEGFRGAVPIDGLILTKLDGDARGGAALSVVAALG